MHAASLRSSMTVSCLGVVVVAYNSVDVILHCLETLLSAAQEDGSTLRVVVVDNGSTDGTAAAVSAWALGHDGYSLPDDLPFVGKALHKPLPEGQMEIIKTGLNGGFAAGVNRGIERLASDSTVARFWVLNPDSVVPPGTPAAFLNYDPGPFSLMGGRVTYYERPEMIQIDGGLLNRWTGVTGNINLYKNIHECAAPAPEDLAFITGASMVVSRAHYVAAGPMPEDYFLYYEEVDWALRRGNLPLVVCADARVYHRGGSSIGSPVPGRPAAPFSLYFKHRARMRFVRRHFPASMPLAWIYTFAKAGQYMLKGWHAEAKAILAGARGTEPPAGIREKLGAEAARLALASF
jgi:GT2 family glycosyltransferase